MTGKSHRTIGYLRVSTGTQDLKKNRAEILAFANEKDCGATLPVDMRDIEGG